MVCIFRQDIVDCWCCTCGLRLAGRDCWCMSFMDVAIDEDDDDEKLLDDLDEGVRLICN